MTGSISTAVWKKVKRKFSLHAWWYWVPGLLFIGLLVYFYSTTANFLNPDLVAYFSIARYYKNLQWIEAFNSHWSPLICWLLALMPQLATEPLQAFRIIQVIIGLILYTQLYFWARLITRYSFGRFVICILIAALILLHTLFIGTPDFLSLLCFLLFLKILIRYKYKSRQTILLALLILIGYFSKAFLLFLCIGILILYFFHQSLLLKKKIPFRQVYLLLFIISLVLIAWVSCLKLHYGFYTLTTAGSFNVSSRAGEITALIPPLSEKAIFAWEDPYNIKNASGYPKGSIVTFKQQLNKWTHNIYVTYYYFHYISYLGIFILIIPFIGLFQKRNRRWRLYTLLMAVFVLNWFGYFLVLLQERYLIIGQVTLYLSVIGFSEIIIERYVKKNIVSITSHIVFLIILVSTIKNPIDEFAYNYKNLPWTYYQDRQAKIVADTGLLQKKKIITSTESKMLYDYLSLSCFLGNGKYYGEISTQKSSSDQWAEIKKHEIDFIAVDIKENHAYFSGLPIVYQDSILHVKILSVK
jgi:hypothetical protein